MDKYADVKNNLLERAEQDTDIKAVVVIGSSVRTEVKADEFSDLDLLIATENPEKWVIGEYPEKLGTDVRRRKRTAHHL